MILSASRRTDIPNYYSDWFLNRIKQGCVYVRNPMNPRQISKIPLSPNVVDCIVFWTKNPRPMLTKLDALSDYAYYFQFTLTCYGTDIEQNVPDKHREIIPTFQELSKKIGAERVILRYDPILFTNQYTPEYHINAFAQIAEKLRGYTQKCVISFVDIYTKNQKAMQKLQVYDLASPAQTAFATTIAQIARDNGMQMASCAEAVDLFACGIAHNCCIDKDLIAQIAGCTIHADKDKNQRKECGCIESIDIGTYNTCQNACQYCYANHSPQSVAQSCQTYDENSPVLCGQITAEDKITERFVKSFKERQMTIWDI